MPSSSRILILLLSREVWLTARIGSLRALVLRPWRASAASLAVPLYILHPRRRAAPPLALAACHPFQRENRLVDQIALSAKLPQHRGKIHFPLPYSNLSA